MQVCPIRQARAQKRSETERLTTLYKEGQQMKRWLVLMAALVTMLAVASAKRVYYPHRWDDPLKREAQQVQVNLPNL